MSLSHLNNGHVRGLASNIVLILYIFCGTVFAEEFVYDSHGKKDPFGPPVVTTAEKTDEEVLSGVKLEGIIWDEKKPLAVINDKVVAAGDEVGGAKVIEIKQHEVLFDVDGQIVQVKLRSKVE